MNQLNRFSKSTSICGEATLKRNYLHPTSVDVQINVVSLEVDSLSKQSRFTSTFSCLRSFRYRKKTLFQTFKTHFSDNCEIFRTLIG